MALVGNYSLLHKSPAKYLTGTVGFNERANFNKPGIMRSRGAGVELFAFDAIPAGFNAGRAFFAPRKAGRMTARDGFSVNALASGASGLPGSATASMSINAVAVGGLIAGGVASAVISINAVASIAGRAAGRANGGMAVNANAAIGASAFGVASGRMTINGVARASGIGYMKASTVDNAALTPQSIAAQVWSATASTNNNAGSMGEKLNDAGSASNPWTEVIESGYTAAQILRLLASFAAGDTTGNPTAPAFKSLDGTKTRLSGAVDSNGNRDATLGDLT